MRFTAKTPTLLGGLAILALSVAAYWPARHNPLIYDDRSLLDNRWLATEAGPVSVFQHDYWYGTRHERSDLYRPLTVLSLAWNMRFAPSKESFRAVNVLLHAGAALAVFWFLSQMATRRAAWIGAALFAVHPLGSEAVLWTVARAETCAAILGMVSFVLFLRRRVWPSAIAFFLALGFKESAAAWIVIGAAWVAMTPRESRLPARHQLVSVLPYAGALVAFLLLRGNAVGWARHPVPFVDNPLVNADVATRAVNAALLFGRYVMKMSWPRSLSVEHGFDQIAVQPIVPWAGLAAVAIAAVIVGVVVALYRRGLRAATFLLAFIPCAFAVTANVLFPIGTIFGERLAYTPLIGFCGLVGSAIVTIPSAWVLRALAGLLLAACLWRTSVRCADFKDVATLSEATAAASPRAVKALVNVARTRMRQGKAAEAIPLLERAVAIWPDYARARELLEQARAGGSGGEER